MSPSPNEESTARWTTKEVNTRAFKSGLLYLRRRLGPERTTRFCRESGLTFEYLSDEGNWVSLEWLNRFYVRMVEETGNPEAPYESGLLASDPEVWGALYFLFRTVGTCGFVYRQVCERTPDFNKLATFRVLRMAHGDAELSYQHAGEHAYVCDNRRGQLAAVPQLWGLPPAQVEELQCQHRGGASCVYRIAWANRSSTLPALLCAVVAGAAAFVLEPASGLATPLHAFALLAAGLGFTVFKLFDLTRANRDQVRFAQLQSRKLELSMHDIERKYDELQRAKGEIEDLNVNLERKVTDRTQQLEAAHAKLEGSFQELKRLERFKSQFFANITHELKTPLSMMLAPIELLVEGDLGPVQDQQRSTLQSVFRQGLKLLKIIGDLLDMSKIEESFIRLRIVEHDVAELLRALVAQAVPLAQRKGIDIRFESAAASSVVWCDPDYLERVFVNLLSNAAKFTRDNGHIVVRVQDDADWLRVEVQDDGVGFPPDQAERIFERFYQVDMGGTRRYGGTGIGLALAREIVRLHGGRISARGEEGKGACFTVQLHKGREHFDPNVLDRRGPQRDRPDGKRATDRSLADWAPDLTSRQEFKLLDFAEATERRVVERDGDEAERQHSVLVVDDTPDVIRAVHLTLRQYFRVLAATDGLKALEIAQTQLPSLIVTDLMMPGIDGNELTRRLRADGRTRHIPIVMLTARGDMEDRVRGIETGVNAYLSKPFSAKELLATARSVLDLQQTAADILLSQRLDSTQALAGGLAHEINNPLNYIKNSLQLVRRDGEALVALASQATQRPLTADEQARLQALGQAVQKMFETAEAGVRRISGTVELMTKYSRDGYARAPQQHDAFAAARDVIDVVLPATGRAVVVEPSFEGSGLLECVPEELHQLVTNLVQNAIEAVPEGTGIVRVRGRADDDEIVLTVEDNGPGIGLDDQARVFSPFFTTKAHGRGMGLTICWRVVQAMRGSITVHSRPGEGTRFEVRLPRGRPGQRISVA
jgi:signal transduction histidine kinase